MSSELDITFTGTVILPNDTLIVSFTTPSGVASFTATETFKLLRLANYQTRIGDDNITPVENVYANNYATAWNFDYSQVGSVNNLLAFDIDSNVKIKLLNSSWQFHSVTGTVISGSKATFVISNQPITDPSSVTLTSYSEDTSDKCGKCFANFTVTGGNDTYNVYEGSALLASNQSSPISVNFNRGYSTKVRFSDTTGLDIGKVSILTPRKLIPSDISVQIVNLTSGSNLSISTSFISSDISPYKYSLDNITYQVSNVFTGLSNGTYTLYVKDDFGCVTINLNILINGVAQTDDVNFFITEINPIRFFELNDERKNYYNTISCGELKSLAYPFYQNYLSTDVIKTQFKTNAPYINCFTLDANENIITQVEVQQTQNTGLRAKSTSTYFDLGDDRSGIYFGVVDMLDYDTNAFIQEVNFGFTLPEWANTEEKYVTIEGIGEVKISSIGYSDTYESFILEFDIAYSGIPVERKISALYNLNPYEVYEFTTDMSTTPDSFNLVIECGVDANNIKFSYISETIKIVEDENFLLRFDYWSDENKGGMVYQTEIKNKIRLKGRMKYVGDQKTEGYDGDKEYFITDNVVYNSYELTIDRLSSAMAHKMRLISGHSELYINGIKSKLAEEPEVSGDENNNFKTFKAVFKQSGNEFLTDAQEQITNTPENNALTAAILAAQGKSFLLWTKN